MNDPGQAVLADPRATPEQRIAALETLILAALAEPALDLSPALDAALPLLRASDLPEALHTRVLWLLAAAIFTQTAQVDEAALQAVGDYLRAPAPAPACVRLAGTLLGFLQHTPARPHLPALLGALAALPARPPAVYEALLEALRSVLLWAPADVPLAEIVTLAEHNHLAPYRAALFDGLIERLLLIDPAAVTEDLLARLTALYGEAPVFRYALASLAGRPTAPPRVRATAAAATRGRFPLRHELQARLSLGRPRVLVAQNIADAQGDEIIRVVPLVQSLLDANPRLEAVVLTARRYLYAHPRLTAINIKDQERVSAVLRDSFAVVLDCHEPVVPELNHVQSLEPRIRAYCRAHRPFLFLAVTKGHNHFVYDEVDLAGASWADRLGLRAQRVANVYETTHRLLVELGLPLRLGEEAPAGPVLAGMPCPEAEAAWTALMRTNAERLPVAVLNPFGGADRLKGYTEDRLAALALRIAALRAESFFVVLLPSGTPWGRAAPAWRAAALLTPEARAGLAIAPDPGAVVGVATYRLGSTIHTVPYASKVMHLFIHFLRRADLVVAVEGWAIHAAYCLGKPYRVLLLPYAHPAEWHPHAPSLRQILAAPLPPDPVAPRAPLVEQPWKSLLLLLLEALGAFADPGAAPALRAALRGEDRDARRVAARALCPMELADLKTDLLPLLHDTHAPVRAAAALALLARRLQPHARADLARETLQAHALIGAEQRDWPAVCDLGSGARPALEAALTDDDPVIRREGRTWLSLLDNQPSRTTTDARSQSSGHIPQWGGSRVRHRGSFQPATPVSRGFGDPGAPAPASPLPAPRGRYVEYQRRQDWALEVARRGPDAPLHGRGIVMLVGGPRYFTCAWVCLTILRRELGCALPVQVWYLGGKEMSPYMITLLRPFDVTCIDATTREGGYFVGPRPGWQAKAFALAHSGFAEAIWLDADTVPLDDPACWLDDAAYRRTGALFWPDRAHMRLRPENPIWEVCRVPFRDEPAFETGLLAIDVARCWAALALAQQMCRDAAFYFRLVNGDSGVLQIAWRMLGKQYGMTSHAPRLVEGRLHPDDYYRASVLLQHDHQGKVILQHRTSAKWEAFGANFQALGWARHAACLTALADLRARWDGQVHPVPAPITTAEASSPPGCFLYRRVGADERMLALLPRGRIGAGSAEHERRWRLRAGTDGRPVLNILGDHGLTCDLTRQADGVWRGRWRHYERMPIELIGLDDTGGVRLPVPWIARRIAEVPADRPRLLYLSPVLPAWRGNGLAMRAGAVLAALAARYSVTLLVVAHYPSLEPDLPADLAALCEETAILPPEAAWWPARPRWRGADRPDPPFVARRFAVIHIFRLAMLPYARPYIGRRPSPCPRTQLDLDEIESHSEEQIARLYRQADDTVAAQMTLRAAALARRREAWALARLDTIYVCSPGDRDRLQGRGKARIEVLPNVVHLPDPPPPPGHGPFTFLFVGTLDYYPNVDALHFFCRAVLPRLRRLAPAPFRLRIVGIGSSAGMQPLTGEPEVEIVGSVPDVGPWYREAHAIVAPIRAGGGTRIKVLEAFSYRRPVVSTSVGVDGIAAQPGEHLLVADTPEAFARACAKLMRDPALAAILANRAHSLVRHAYTPEALSRALEGHQ